MNAARLGGTRFTAKAIDIVHQGLSARLDMKADGPLAQSLWSLYEDAGRRLMAANSGDAAACSGVRLLLTDLRGAWTDLHDQGTPARRSSCAHPVQHDTLGPAHLAAYGRSIAT